MGIKFRAADWGSFSRGTITGAAAAVAIGLSVTHVSEFWAGEMDAAIQDYNLDPAERTRVLEAAGVFAEVMTLVETQHVKKDLSDPVLEEMIDGALARLDRYSGFMSRESADFVFDRAEARRPQVGFLVNGSDGAYRIEAVVPGSPAEQAGLVPGDRVVRVNGEYVADLDVGQVHAMIRDLLALNPGKVLSLGIRRPSVGDEKTITLMARDMNPTGAYALGVSEGGVLHLAVDYFYEGLREDVLEAIRGAAKEGGIRAMVIDLRNNGGGLTDEMVRVISMFLPEDLPLYEMTGKKVGVQVFHTVKDGRFLDMPLAVIINGNSASASEIFASAIQVHDRGALFGWKSFGKGTVQRVFPFGDRGAVKITAAHYRDGALRDIDGIGVSPDRPATTEDPGHRPSRFAEDPVRDAAIRYLEARLEAESGAER